ncbi:MAG: dihydropteroate synthase [Bacteroidales bacterium]|jgi:dihydropteroate synthase|nr:dihydropteroate synthase [Bacteroidales bacterium]
MKQIFCNGRVLDLTSPVVMGILNVTPDSFFDGGRYLSLDDQLKRAEQMIADGAAIIDIGAVSTRPGSKEVSREEEMERLLPPLKAIRHHFSGCFISVDTYRAPVAKVMVENGADIINDIYGGRFDEEMLQTIAGLNVPYILMHMKGTPETMQKNPEYSDVVAEITYFFEQQLARCREAGVRQVIIDPGFGFGKTVEHNFSLLSHLDTFQSLEVPILAGLSRKSMINKALQIKPQEALNGTTVLNTVALLKGADILRVHDVKEAVEAVKLVRLMMIPNTHEG